MLIFLSPNKQRKSNLEERQERDWRYSVFTLLGNDGCSEFARCVIFALFIPIFAESNIAFWDSLKSIVKLLIRTQL